MMCSWPWCGSTAALGRLLLSAVKASPPPSAQQVSACSQRSYAWSLGLPPSRRRHLSSFRQLPWSEIQPYKNIRVDLTRTGLAIGQQWDPPLVDPSRDAGYCEDFQKALSSHLSHWKAEGRTAVWLHLPIELGALLPVAEGLGFALHHARGREIVMNVWLAATERKSPLPHYASHQVGVCGVVLREDKMEVLVTQDKYKKAMWKLPGGLSDFAEDIADTAVREVREETGVISEFQSVLAFRQHHRMPNNFDCSDLFFACRMRPLTTELVPCTHEVLKCEWRPLEELAWSQGGEGEGEGGEAERVTPFTQKICRLVLQGLDSKSGFSSIDISLDEWPSFYNITTKVFHR